MVEHFEGKVRGAESDISDILKQERTEKELRLAEMEANKASNLMKHAAAIAARPARTWCVPTVASADPCAHVPRVALRVAVGP